MPAPGDTAFTVAVNVTLCPTVEGLGLEVKPVLVLARFTFCVEATEVLPLKFVLPPYTAVMECDATDKPEVVRVAWPLAFSVPVPKVLVPSLKVTEPVGVPAPGGTAETVAVNVTS